MEPHGVPVATEPQAGASGSTEEMLNLGAWFQRSWTTATSLSGQGADILSGFFDRFREADALGYDNEGDQTDN